MGKLLLLASLASLGLAAPQNSFFVLTRGSGARESTSYIDYSTGLRSSSSKVASPKVIRPTTDSALAYMKEYFGEDLCLQGRFQGRCHDHTWKSVRSCQDLLREELHLWQVLHGGHHQRQVPEVCSSRSFQGLHRCL